ncbi:Zinc-binding dehydrogenase [Phytophthora infestans]|uniref:Zinc-binding dehydrogenase n=1 Tax=Phytophthora infestans TaxID=4787 RepID=A0A8S9V6N0_PHYIN|nr:Zinc-binding dehydrogenase [Phytophthora infestans]
MTFPSTYRAYQYEKYGPIETELKLKAGLPQRTLSAQQVRIKVRSAAVNPIDYKLAEFMGQMFFGKAPSVDEPFNVGFDVSGEVVEVGSDVKRVKIGAAVYASTPLNDMGTLAEYLVVDEGFVALKPSNLSFNQAAALTDKLKKDDAVLILGGSTAVGMFAIQFAHNIGAHVLARHSVDVLYDCGVEPSSWNDGAQLVLKKSTGRFITLLPMPEPVKESEFGAQLIGFVSAVDNSAKALEVITKYVEGGKARPVVDSVYPFEKDLDAYKKLKTNHAQGKLVVQVHA